MLVHVPQPHSTMKGVDVVRWFSTFVCGKEVILKPPLFEDVEVVLSEFLAKGDEHTYQLSVEVGIWPPYLLPLLAKHYVEKFPDIELPGILVYCLYLDMSGNAICVSENIYVGYVAGKWRSNYSSSPKFSRYKMLTNLASQFCA